MTQLSSAVFYFIFTTTTHVLHHEVNPMISLKTWQTGLTLSPTQFQIMHMT